MFHPKSPYFKICADVVVQNVTVVKDHTHSIPSTSSSSSPRQTSTLKSLHSSDAAQLGRSLTDSTFNCFPLIAATFFKTFLTVGLITLSKISAKGLANRSRCSSNHGDRCCGCYCAAGGIINYLF